jgi:AcrR family transcriptional regulator
MAAPTANASRSDAQRTHQLILHTAAAVLLADPAAGMERIAVEAGISRATLYRHFPSREALEAALHALLRDEIIRLTEQSIAEPDPEAALRSFVDGCVRTVATTCRFAGPADERPKDEVAMAAIGRMIDDFVGRAQRAKRLRPGVDQAWTGIVGKALIDAAAAQIAAGANADEVAARTADTVAAALLV